MTSGARATWRLEEGDELVPGRTVLRPLGGGSRFEVLLVWDEHLHAIAVAKTVRPDQARDERALRDLAEEADLLSRLAHPVLLRGFDAVLDGPRPHLLVEHLEGPTLRSLVRRGGALPLEQLLPLGMHLAAVLHYLHGEAVVHLDVKPDNVVVGVPPRLIDLSVARHVDRAGRLRGPLGTDAYMAPEQCDPQQRGPVGPPADVWGLGATLHHALARRVPFPRPDEARDSDDPHVRFPQLVREPEPLPREVPEPVAAAVRAALHPDPRERPAPAALATALEAVLAQLPWRAPRGRRGLR